MKALLHNKEMRFAKIYEPFWFMMRLPVDRFDQPVAFGTIMDNLYLVRHFILLKAFFKMYFFMEFFCRD